ncbi:ROK family transcriptional regulator [Streptomyces sp. NPDC001231]|uniref:ROK family transcriptional regulator n=1 Tax=unclassified Streptomyces TaxID=2593676 RepID=UPI00367CA6AC
MREDPPLLRQLSQGRVLTVLREVSHLRLAEIARRTGLSRPTVSEVVDELRAAGWVEYVEEHPDSRNVMGRPARLVRFRADAGCVLGIDIGPHRTSAVIADLNGEPLATSRCATSAAQDSRELLAAVRLAVRGALDEAGLKREAVLAAAVGSPGILDPRSGKLAQAPGLPGWTSLNLKAELRRTFRCPVQVENDVNLAVLGEQWKGIARNTPTVVFALWGERVGGGICIDGRLHRGTSGAAGEIGYLTVLDPHDDLGARPDAEGLGPFERLTGASAIVDLAGSLPYRRSPRLAALLREGALDVVSVFDAAADGDPGAQGVIDTVAARLARGLAPVLLVLDPDLLVIGGGLSRAGRVVLDAVTRHLRPLTLVPTPIELSRLGDDAVVMGAVRLALDDVENRLLPPNEQRVRSENSGAKRST